MRLGPRYRVVDEIAAGGMGAVVLALRTGSSRDGRVGGPVAIKKLHAHLVDNPDIVGSFVDEARIASRIDHPNVVAVHDVEMIGDELMIVMDYVEGVPFRDLIRGHRKRDAVLAIPVVRRILVDALEGLHAAHELADDDGAPLGVVHRDVSPHNLLVGADGVTRVTDFGIAMAAGRIASTKTDGGVKGKLHYLSPEQVFRKPVDRRTDVFAAGVVTWEALVGRRLFDAGTEGETLAMILREPIRPPSTHRFDVPLDLDEACLRALEREPERRFASAWDFARALEEGGPLATREEVAALVLAEAGPGLMARRESLAAESRAEAPPSGGIHEDDETPAIALPRDTGSVEQLMFSNATYEQGVPADVSYPAPIPPRARSSSGTLVIVAAVCVSAGLLAGFFMRATPARRTSEPSPTSIVTTVVASVTPPVGTPASTAPPMTAATSAATSAPAPSVKAGPHRPKTGRDAGRGRPFMPDDL